MCEFCKSWKEKETLYQENAYCNLLISKFVDHPVLVVDDLKKGCPQGAKCSTKDMHMSAAFKINFCPNCGEKLE